jgi:peroxiredoxin
MKTLLLTASLITGLSFSAIAGPKQEDGKKSKATAKVEPTLKVGDAAPDFKITDSTGKEIDLAELSKDGPVLVRLTCGCLGCDMELPYFQALHEAYKDQGLTSLAVFAEKDEKFAEYAKTNKLDMRYALDPKKDSWKVFGTKTMPSNFLIEKGGKVAAISKGCNPEGLKVLAMAGEAAKVVGTEEVDLTKNVTPRPKKAKKEKAKKTATKAPAPKG